MLQKTCKNLLIFYESISYVIVEQLNYNLKMSLAQPNLC